jgi:PncC family amidohydrolase
VTAHQPTAATTRPAHRCPASATPTALTTTLVMPIVFPISLFLREYNTSMPDKPLEAPLEAQVGDLLRQRGLRLAVAESCTGGLLGHRLTNVPGSSDYFLGGVIAYANQAKMDLLGVRLETLEAHGAVSQETVIEMARGACRALGADVGLSVSGVAGPGGGTPEKPVGLVWIGLCAPGVERGWSFHWQAERVAVKEHSAEQALRLLLNYLSA